MGFLLFNVYPASVFMGDTGSLALGGFVAATAYMLQMPIFLLIVGLIYLVEVLSVIIQVTYFKKTGGKRIFRMAPIPITAKYMTGIASQPIFQYFPPENGSSIVRETSENFTMYTTKTVVTTSWHNIFCHASSPSDRLSTTFK